MPHCEYFNATVALLLGSETNNEPHIREKKKTKKSPRYDFIPDFNRAASILFTISTPVKYYIITLLEYICISVLKGTVDHSVLQVKLGRCHPALELVHCNVISTVASTGLNVSLVNDFAARWPPRMPRYLQECDY